MSQILVIIFLKILKSVKIIAILIDFKILVQMIFI